MEERKPRPPLFERLKKGLEETLQHAKGEIELKTTVLEIPEETPKHKKTAARKVSKVGTGVNSATH